MSATDFKPEIVSEAAQLKILEELWDGFDGVWDLTTIQLVVLSNEFTVIDEAAWERFTTEVTVDRSRCIQCGKTHNDEINEGVERAVYEVCGHEVMA